MGGVVLLTGGTGFLGSQVLRGIVKHTDPRVVALVRARDTQAASLSALAPFGARVSSQPITPEKILRALGRI